MKKKFLAILLSALMIATLLPMSMAVSAASDLIGDLNLDFEDAFVNVTVSHATAPHSEKVPAAGYAVSAEYRKEHNGNFSAVSTEDFPAATYESTKSLKIERTTPESESVTGYYSFYSGDVNAYLTTGTYAMEFYYNIPTALTDMSFEVGIFRSNTATGTNFAGSSFTTSKATNGWVKKTLVFEYDSTQAGVIRIGTRGTGTGACTVYVDELKIYSYVPETVLIQSEDFTSMTTDTANSISGGYITRASRGSVAIIADPTDASNNVMSVTPTNLSNPVGSVLKMSTNDAPAAVSTGTGLGTVKVSFRLYVPTATYTSGETEMATNVDGFKFGLLYYDNRAGSGSTSSKVEVRCTFPGSDANKWLYCEAYLKDFMTTQPDLSFYPGQLTTYYIDDISVERISNGGYISRLNIKGINQYCRTTTTNTDQNWGYFLYGDYSTTVNKNATIQPLIAMTATEANQNGLAIAGIYKIEGTRRTLVNIKIQPVARIAVEDLTGCYAAEVGVSSTGLQIDLAEENLGTGNFEIEYFLWNSNLAPISSTHSFRIVD